MSIAIENLYVAVIKGSRVCHVIWCLYITDLKRLISFVSLSLSLFPHLITLKLFLFFEPKKGCRFTWKLIHPFSFSLTHTNTDSSFAIALLLCWRWSSDIWQVLHQHVPPPLFFSLFAILNSEPPPTLHAIININLPTPKGHYIDKRVRFKSPLLFWLNFRSRLSLLKRRYKIHTVLKRPDQNRTKGDQINQSCAGIIASFFALDLLLGFKVLLIPVIIGICSLSLSLSILSVTSHIVSIYKLLKN